VAARRSVPVNGSQNIVRLSVGTLRAHAHPDVFTARIKEIPDKLLRLTVEEDVAETIEAVRQSRSKKG
jgi:hypothetical protein